MKGYKPHTIRDQVQFLTNAARLRRPALTVLSRMQDFTPGEQILGTAVALIAICQSANISLQDVMTTAQNVLADAEGPFTAHIQSIRDFAANEIARGEEYRA